ncbi:MAG: deoxyribonuclease IV [Phycisphaerales bacterium]
MFGSHLSIAGGLAVALEEAERLGLDCVQVFTKNQQQWRAPPLTESAVKTWRDAQGRLGWAGRNVAHASYLINLATPDDELWKKSINLMEEELRRCEALGIAFLVHHPGAYTTSSLEAGLDRIAAAYGELFERTAGFGTISCLENTAGGGSTIGREFGELASLRARIVKACGKEAEGRVGYCFDTCHAHAAGYDMGSFEGAGRTLDELDRVCGLERVRVLHLNDSKGACGSRLDRHEHIGKGTIGVEGFRAVVNRRELRESRRPMILETPKGESEGGIAHDRLNLRRLRKLVAE